MSPQIQRGTVVFRRWDRHTGLDETPAAFSTLEDLFELCLQANEPLLVDRIIIEGKDDAGLQRVVTLIFQSLTVSDSRSPDDDA